MHFTRLCTSDLVSCSRLSILGRCLFDRLLTHHSIHSTLTANTERLQSVLSSAFTARGEEGAQARATSSPPLEGNGHGKKDQQPICTACMLQ